jgi:hypothetical protein
VHRGRAGKILITTQQRRIAKAQRRARQLVKRGKSLVDELLAERRQAAKHEHELGLRLRMCLRTEFMEAV